MFDCLVDLVADDIRHEFKSCSVAGLSVTSKRKMRPCEGACSVNNAKPIEILMIQWVAAETDAFSRVSIVLNFDCFQDDRTRQIRLSASGRVQRVYFGD